MATPAGSVLNNLYRVYFSQPNNADHEALALIPQDSVHPSKGTLYHVIGMLALGMEYDTRKTKDVSREKGYSRQVLLGTLKTEDSHRFDTICQSVIVPCDDRLLFENRTSLEARGEKVRDCAGWIDDVVAELEKQSLLDKADN